mmetsp:Transcript_39197/g.51690  ORF Transcript_39197/g.51690 Transcript_39197/m.51690 type:complete len:117 (-) Transcript_39197:317-667(-)
MVWADDGAGREVGAWGRKKGATAHPDVVAAAGVWVVDADVADYAVFVAKRKRRGYWEGGWLAEGSVGVGRQCQQQEGAAGFDSKGCSGQAQNFWEHRVLDVACSAVELAGVWEAGI